VGFAASNGSSPGNTINNIVADGQGGFTMFGDSDPHGDVCSSTTSPTTEMTGKNIGDLLNAKNITWGWFQGGFNLQAVNANGTSGCTRSTSSPTVGSNVTDYVPHHQPFQYYPSTRNLSHTRPTSVAAIGTAFDGGANHQYDTSDFFAAVQAGNLPSVSFLKAAAIQDAHPSNSDPLDEQTFVVNVINTLQQSPEWKSTAVILAYDDSDGWYDHAFSPTTRPSFSSADALNGAASGGNPGLCGTVGATEPAGVNGLPVAGRCGPGTRQPFLVISPYAKKNYVSHVLITQASIPQFIEDNWLKGERVGGGSYDATTGSIVDMFNFNKSNRTELILDPTFGTVDTKKKSKND
jgi:phospholipase C